MEKTDILSLNIDELKLFVKDIGEKPFRAKQIFEWCHKKLIRDFNDMTNISLDLRHKLIENAKISKMEILDKLVSKKDNTTKYLFEIENNNIIESVLMKYEYGNAVCISSQAGCRMGCSFCASTIEGLERNLTAGEMLSQVYKIQSDSGERVSNIVIMGSGEPFDNFENVLKFLQIINSKDGLDIGQRHITVSTCGLVDKIYEFAQKKMQVTLAISLHAPNDEIRRKLMPVAKKYSIEQVIEAAKAYGDTTKRRVTFEYALVSGINDGEEAAKELAKRLKGSLCHVNLIPVNEVKEKNYKKSSNDTVKKFAEILCLSGVETTVRRKLGSDINAACGQLRRGYKEQKEV